MRWTPYARVPCADCGKPVFSHKAILLCSKCMLKGRCPVCEQHFPNKPPGVWCDSCQKALKEFRELTRPLRGRRPSRDVLPILIERYKQLAGWDLPLFEEPDTKAS